jgi:hypothetical protein
MEQITNNFQNFGSYSDSYNFKLIELAFQYFNSNLRREKFENDVEGFISEFNQYKPNETKINLKFLIEFLEKNLNIEDSVLEEFLTVLSIMDFNFINETKRNRICQKV